MVRRTAWRAKGGAVAAPLVGELHPGISRLLSSPHRLGEGPPIDVRGLRPAIRLPATLIWRKERHQTPATRAFIDFVRGSTAATIR
jgi:DNA-binding transcriptional LysR family regulator